MTRLLRLTILISFFAFPSAALAQIQKVQKENGFAPLSELTVVFANVASVVSTLIGFVVLIMFIRGGIGYMLAQGDPKAVASARGTLTMAIIGLIVVLSAFLIINFIAGFVNIPGLGKFCIPSPTRSGCPLGQAGR